MKRYIKSFTTEQLKAKLGDNYPKGGYLYIFKHGIGPGAIPNDVSVVKVKDLPNYYTAVWLDRFLTTSELKQYDIPSETRINELLDRIGYCQKNGDVVPCDEVEACGNVMASTDKRKFTKFPSSDIKHLAKAAVDCDTKDELAGVISELDSLSLRKLFLHYMEMLRDDSLSVAYIAGQLSDELMSYYVDDVEACDKVTASEICYRDRDNDDRVVALDVGMSDEDVEEMLVAHPSYYRSTLDRFDDVDACDNVMASSGIFYTDQGAGIGSRNQVFTEDDLRAVFNSLLAEGDPVATSYDSFEAWRDATIDSGLLGIEFLDEDVENPDIDFDETDIDATTEPKYFANMVSASNDPELDDNFLVEGYYDNQRRGLAESAETSDVSALNELIYEYANKGYYIVVHNLTDGVITEFSADNWFDDLARDGGAGLFMS